MYDDKISVLAKKKILQEVDELIAELAVDDTK